MKSEILNRWAQTGPELNELLPLSLYTFANEHELIKSIEQVQQYLTVNRSELAQVYQDPKLVSAYFLFYFPTHILKLKPYLNKVPAAALSLLQSVEQWVDFGSGPGTYAWPLISLIGPKLQSLHLVETSALMREQAQIVKNYLFGAEPSPQISIGPSMPKLNRDRSTGIFFGHSFNEWNGGDVDNLLRGQNWKAIVLLEPGTKDAFQKMLHLRNILTAKGYDIVYPCPTSASCPMAGQNDWCHQFLRLTFPPDIERLSQKAKINRRDVANIFHVYIKHSEQNVVTGEPRIVGGAWEEKGKFEWMQCDSVSGVNKIERKQILKRKLSKDQESEWEDKFPGDRGVI